MVALYLLYRNQGDPEASQKVALVIIGIIALSLCKNFSVIFYNGITSLYKDIRKWFHRKTGHKRRRRARLLKEAREWYEKEKKRLYDKDILKYGIYIDPADAPKIHVEKPKILVEEEQRILREKYGKRKEKNHRHKGQSRKGSRQSKRSRKSKRNDTRGTIRKRVTLNELTEDIKEGEEFEKISSSRRNYEEAESHSQNSNLEESKAPSVSKYLNDDSEISRNRSQFKRGRTKSQDKSQVSRRNIHIDVSELSSDTSDSETETQKAEREQQKKWLALAFNLVFIGVTGKT